MDRSAGFENLCKFCDRKMVSVCCAKCSYNSWQRCTGPLTCWNKDGIGTWYCCICRPLDMNNPECWLYGTMGESHQVDQNRPSTSRDSNSENAKKQEPFTPKNNVTSPGKSKTNKLGYRTKTANFSLSPSTSRQQVPIVDRSKSAKKALVKQFERNPEENQWKKTPCNLQIASDWNKGPFDNVQRGSWATGPFNLEEAGDWNKGPFDSVQRGSWATGPVNLEEAGDWNKPQFDNVQRGSWTAVRLNLQEQKPWTQAPFNLEEMQKLVTRYSRQGHDNFRQEQQYPQLLLEQKLKQEEQLHQQRLLEQQQKQLLEEQQKQQQKQHKKQQKKQQKQQKKQQQKQQLLEQQQQQEHQQVEQERSEDNLLSDYEIVINETTTTTKQQNTAVLKIPPSTSVNVAVTEVSTVEQNDPNTDGNSEIDTSNEENLHFDFYVEYKKRAAQGDTEPLSYQID